MKKLTFIVVGVLTALAVTYAAYKAQDLESGSTYYKDSIHLDTTGYVWVEDYEYITLSTGFTGSTSNTFTSTVQGYFGGAWQNVHTIDTVDSFTVYNYTIKNKDTNRVGAAQIIRFINSVTTSDSSALLKYYQSVFMTK